MKKSKHCINTQKLRTQIEDSNVFLEGDLRIAQIGQIRNDLNEVLNRYDTLKVTVRNVTSLDLACIQLLYAFIKTCTQQNKKALLDINLDPDLELLLTKCGLKFKCQ
jgi:ABC-type transporter Mla MlaB component